MILVTGASGFLGSELVQQLATGTTPVRVLVRKPESVAHLTHAFPHLQVAVGDILDISSLESAMQGVEQVYHSAAVIGYDRSYYDSMYKTNIEGTANVVNVALSSGVKRLLHVSSIAAIGGKPGELIHEDTKWEKNKWTTHYGITKMLAEREIWRGIQEGLEAVIVNPGIIVGTGHTDHKATQRLFRQIASGKLPFYTPGTNGFIDVEDTASAMILLMNSAVHSERFILISENMAFRDYFTKVAAALGVPPPKLCLNPFLKNLFITADWVVSLTTGQKRRVSRENMKVAMETFAYSNEKFRKTISFEFQSMDSTIQKVARQMQLV